MFRLTTFLLLNIFSCCSLSFAQTGTIAGKVSSSEHEVAFATVIVKGTSFVGIVSDSGTYQIPNIPVGTYELEASMIGFQEISKFVTVSLNEQLIVDFELEPSSMLLNAIVVTGTKTFKRKIDSPVMVNIVDSKTLANVQACNLSEGLKFQPGLRVETDCQTCNYTQLRMNGLAGGYSQILINGRPIFSPLTGLYGMEQLPANMIDRIEVVRGGGSSLYGSSAIGGTVNVITKIPKKNTYELNYFYQNINNQSSDHNFSGNATVVSENQKSGVSFFVNNRNRELYDHNGDGFSEIPLIQNTSLGTNFFILPKENQKLEVNLSNINEYRYGGEITDKPAYLTQQSEERTHHVWLGSADYQINFNQEQSSIITYLAWQNTDRRHYTGIFPDDSLDIQNHLQNAPYGTSTTTTFQGGLQFNHRINNFLKGVNVLTLGSEYVVDDVYDNIEAYRYTIDQVSKDLGFFVQSDWEIMPSLTLLSGLRMDKHNLVDPLVFSPRASLLYKLKNALQFRLSYGTGFRAPQAFDTDLHIAFAGGGVSRVILAPDLKAERSQSFSASVNYDKATEKMIAGFTLEAFHTHLKDAFYLSPQGEDRFGEVFEKQNGPGATVQGFTLELRGNYNRILQLETGFTLQTSQYEAPVSYIAELDPLREFLRTPEEYGFANLSITPKGRFNANLNFVYTGSMKVAHFAGAPNQAVDEIIDSRTFRELNLKVAYTLPVRSLFADVELYGGIKNIFNAYQDDFDIGKNRDSNYVYGTAAPRILFMGMKFRSK